MTQVPAPAFFEAAAQLIPLLFLVVLVENRLRLPVTPANPSEERHVRGFLVRMLLLASVVIGEIAALVAVAGHGTLVEAGVVIQVLGVLGIYVLAPAVIEEIVGVKDHARGRGRIVLGVIAVIVWMLPLLPAMVFALPL